jgi:hypothetical protein
VQNYRITLSSIASISDKVIALLAALQLISCLSPRALHSLLFHSSGAMTRRLLTPQRLQPCAISFTVFV